MRYASRHIIGTFTVEFVDERIFPTSPLFRSANKTRATMLRAAQLMPREDAALFMGLVIGDDRAQPRDMIASFRKSGLSHLTAVSGQNVAFVLTVFGVYFNRARTWWRLGLTLFLLGWFVVMTRAEPSVLRAAMMATMSAVAISTPASLSLISLLSVITTVSWCILAIVYYLVVSMGMVFLTMPGITRLSMVPSLG